MRAALKAGENVQAMAEQLLKEEAEPGAVLRRYMVNDATVEKLGVILNENPQGILVFRDELTGWLYTLDKEGHENDRAFYLEAWNGNGPYTYDRIGRGSLFIPAACVSLLGGIQPSRLAEYLRATTHGGDGDDGLMQRFQLAVYPDSHGAWRNVDRWPNSEAKQKAYKLFKDLDALSPLLLGIAPQEGESVSGLRFDSAAQGFFDEWRSTLEGKIRDKKLHPALESHLAKYRSLMPSLALLFFLLDYAAGTATGKVVPSAPAELAAAWCDFLENHAYRIYSGVTEHALFSARLLAERLPQGALPNPFTLGNVQRKHWSGLSTVEDVREAVDLLEESYWIRAEKVHPGEKGGRPSVQYWIHPRVLPPKDTTE
jgi:putative DNA primase/helicase